METRFYLSVFPLEALIASQLTPDQFGSYMATGSKNGSYERIMFIEVEGGFGSDFDWDYAAERCVQHADGSPKHSVWMSAYRALEHTPIDKMKSMFLTTKDGRTLEVPPADFVPPATKRDFNVYLELCPIHPLVVSELDPQGFASYMTDPKNHVHVPKVIFADLKTIDFDDPENTGNIGRIYDRNIEHLKDCISAVVDNPDKPNKNVERSLVESFDYQTIQEGIYVGDGEKLAVYRLPSVEELRKNHYDWARSAMVL
jgi:hypothetical protein